MSIFFYFSKVVFSIEETTVKKPLFLVKYGIKISSFKSTSAFYAFQDNTRSHNVNFSLINRLYLL